jgi:hypothetical protein
MSITSLRRLSTPKLFVFVVALAAVVTAISCLSFGESQENADKRFYSYFLRDEKAMEDMGLPVYWLGRGFTAGGWHFMGLMEPNSAARLKAGGLSPATFPGLLQGGLRAGTHG